MNNPPIGPAGALRIAYEVIDAQAAHIKNLERGHYGRESRHAVEEAREKLKATERATELGSCCAAGACQDICEPPTEEDRLIQAGFDAMEADGEARYQERQRAVRKGDLIGYTTTSNPGDPGHPIVGPLYGDDIDDPPRWAASPYQPLANRASIDMARRQAPPEHTLTNHPEAAWPAKGACARCDHLQPLWDAEQRLIQVEAQRRAGTVRWQPDRNPDGTPKITTNPDGTRTLHWQEPETGPGRTEGGGHSTEYTRP